MTTFLEDFFPPPPTRYAEVPPEAPQPRIWKSLGQCVPGVEAQYALDGMAGDMDIDREIELRQELAGVIHLLANRAVLTEGMVLSRQVGKPLLVRFVSYEYSTLYVTRN